MQPDLDESAEDCDICDRGGRRSGRKRSANPPEGIVTSPLDLPSVTFSRNRR